MTVELLNIECMYHIAIKHTKPLLPEIVKSYPYKIQCVTWLVLKGYVYHGRGRDWIDGRITILSDSVAGNRNS